jgi:hypothetical protein
MIQNMRFEKKAEKLKEKALAAALGMTLLFYAQGARAAAPAVDNVVSNNYQNPWGPTDPQNQPTSGFAPWVFDEYNPPYNPPSNPPPNPFFIDKTRNAWGINVPRDYVPPNPPLTFPGYDAAWRSFTGDGVLDPGQTFWTNVFFTPPGPYSTTELPSEGVDFFAQAPGVPSRYDTFGHQVLGIYLGPNTPSGPVFILAVHTTLSDENANVYKRIPIPFTGTATSPQLLSIVYTQYAQGHWRLWLVNWTPLFGILFPTSNLVLTSNEYGATWNAQGVDAVRYFTSQGGNNPGGPLEWEYMVVY